MTKQEWFKLIQELYAIENGAEIEASIDCNSWIPVDPPAKELIKPPIGSVDALNLKRDAIEKAIITCQQVSVGNFLLLIKDKQENNKSFDYNVILYETIYKTANNIPCNIKTKTNIAKDSRFEGRPWRNLFNQFGSKANIPGKTLVDVIKYLQAIEKMPAFL